MTIETSIRIALGTLMASAVVMSATYRGRAHRAGGTLSRREEGWFMLIALRLAGLLALGGLLLWIFAPHKLAFAALPFPPAVRVTGALLATIAFGCQWWVLHSLGLNITDTVAVRPNATLVTHGPYRWIRHPLYSFGSLFVLGANVATANGLLLGGAILFSPLLAARTGREEERLIAHFGDDYRDYARRTGRFVPRLGGRA